MIRFIIFHKIKFVVMRDGERMDSDIKDGEWGWWHGIVTLDADIKGGDTDDSGTVLKQDTEIQDCDMEWWH